jgi:predicted acyltransferase
MVETKPPTGAAVPSDAMGRLVSLDALRGFDMFWIIGGGAMVQGLAKGLDGPLNTVLPQLEHVQWEGLHCWDLIWPLFMFLVGVAIPFSIAGRRAAGAKPLPARAPAGGHFVLSGHGAPGQATGMGSLEIPALL